MPPRSIDEVFEAIKKLKVLVIGDVMLDAYIHGSVRRISPEAPVPVVNVESQEDRLGGAANVALNLQALGATPIICSVIGDDLEGETFIKLLRKQNLQNKGLIRSAERITTLKQRILSSSHYLLRIDREEETPLNTIDRKTLVNHIRNLLPEVDLVIIEDYDKGCLDNELIQEVIQATRKKNIPIAVDPKNKPFKTYDGASLFKPNLSELTYSIGKKIEPEETSLLNAVEELRSDADFDEVIVTLSSNGVFYHNKNNYGLFKSHKRQIADISGAGDTVISIAAVGLALKLPLSFIAEFANLGGGIVCEYQGVVPIDQKRLFDDARNSQFLQQHLL